MNTRRITPLALAVSALLATGLPGAAQAQSTGDLLQELKALKARMAELESRLQAVQKAAAAPAPAAQPPAVDADEFNRIRGKVEAMEDGHETMGFKGLRIGGVIDPTFVYTQRQNNAGFVFLNNFDGRSPGECYAFDNSYFGMAMLDVQKVTDTDQRWRLTLAPHKSASSGTNLGSIVHEASVALPLDGPNLRLLAGQFPDWSGYEYYFANQQPLISHNLLFDFTVPSFYSGVGMEFVNGKWATKVLLGNINQVRVPDGQKSPGLSFRVDYAKGEFSGFGFAGSYTTTKGAQVTQGEVDGCFIRGDWTLQGQLGLGSARGYASNLDAEGNALSARWVGLSALAGYKLTPRLQLVGRADYLWNARNGGGVWGASIGGWDGAGAYTPDGRNGFGLPMAYDEASGTWAPAGSRGVNRYAVALGLNYLLTPSHTPNSGLWPTGTWLKAELRLDGASGRVFQDVRDGSYRKNNLMFATSAVFAF